MRQSLTPIISCLLVALSCSCQHRGPVDETISLYEADSPFVAFNIWVKVGSQNDPTGKEGLASLTAEFLADSSTQSDGYDQILKKLYPMATGYTASVDKEMTVFRGMVHKDNLKEFYRLFKNAILAPAFRDDDFKRIKTQTVSYLSQVRRFSSDEELGKELLSREIFRNTPYEHPEEGYVTSVEGISLDDVKAFYRQYYAGNRIVVGVAGGFPQGFARQVRADFNQLPEGEVEEIPAPVPLPINGLNVLIVEKQTKATAISLGFPISLLRSDNDYYAMMLVNSWLGEHRNSSSHLYQVIREIRGMNYGDYSYIEAYPMGHTRSMPPSNVSRRQQFFQIWIRPVSMLNQGDLHNRALFATRAALRELCSLVDSGLTPEQLETTRGFLRNYTANYGNTISRRLGYRIDDMFYGIPDPGHLASIRPELEKLTLDEVNTTLRKYLQCRNMWLVFVTHDAQGLKQKLLSGVDTPITYAAKKPQPVLDEDREIQSFPLPVTEEKIHIIDINQVFER